MGDMAIANAVGSNVFDILLGLGFPWMLRGLINIGDDDPCNDTFTVKKCGIEISVAILFGTLGVSFLVIYILHIIFILLSAFPVGAPVLDVSGGCVEPLPPLGCPGNMGLPAANASLAN